MELTILMPCLNEARTLPRCISEAQIFLETHALAGEVLIADNGSTDGSVQMAEDLGARVVHVSERGYGAALKSGIASARGKYVIFGDSDESYDFSRLETFLAELRSGASLVVGNRFKGGIEKGAMPFLHRYLGNPVLSFIGRRLFNASIGDFHCGLRGFDKKSILDLNLKTTGMEFASEIIIRAVLSNLKVTEVPTVLRRDGRDRPPHLKTWTDGWRHLIYMLLHSPQILFVMPGSMLFGVSLLASITLSTGPQAFGSVVFDIHSLLFSAAAAVAGIQLIFVGLLMQLAGVKFDLWPPGKLTSFIEAKFRLEWGLMVGAGGVIVALLLASKSLSYWHASHYAAINPSVAMRMAVPAVMVGLGGLQTMMFSMAVAFIISTKKK
ncbi:glycosyltransferase family 2 protein [Aquabacterium sp. CECT 9606]|uniref:glycosyltransferase family 2 protein n=1 Tax=Aquabacterium sp. CECT 9606 TaxID=2845822 RepID=UPI001E5CB0F0|nr:glycosyltransferase family 2 protein [Aquabacterium sp. CECT 9606]CAH0348130.1 hypothetical protein AQB9606_00352 [Aquabacterium sp. CECT 9606]